MGIECDPTTQHSSTLITEQRRLLRLTYAATLPYSVPFRNNIGQGKLIIATKTYDKFKTSAGFS
jgi:hypothetical protein